MGTGQKTARGTAPARRTAAYQAALTDGTPYAREPGGAASRSATSACTITSPRRSVGSSSSRCSSTGTATLYGRLATSAVGCGAGTLVSLRASAARTVSRRARSGRRVATVRGNASASTGSTSTAVTCAAASSRPKVSEPSPGPISSTTSSGSSRAVRTIRRIVFGSCRKFCPSALVGRMPSSATSARTSAGPSSPAVIAAR